MTDDLLQQYTSALRQEYDGATASPEATRARVIRTLAERRPRRAKWWAIGIPAFVLLGGSTAWAAASGQLTVIVEKAGVALGIVDDAPALNTPQDLKPKLAWSAAKPTDDEPQQDESDAIEEVEPTEEPPEETMADLHRPGPPDSEPVLQKSKEPTEDDRAKQRQLKAEAEAIAAYRRGHEAHHAEGNCAKAVSAYSSYLSRYPTGSFVLEARYDRAVCLVQVGQLEEAQRALRPFAQGKFGGYRKEQASSLLDALTEATGRSEPDQFDQ